jgi:hypothetical protein
MIDGNKINDDDDDDDDDRQNKSEYHTIEPTTGTVSGWRE